MKEWHACSYTFKLTASYITIDSTEWLANYLRVSYTTVKFANAAKIAATAQT